MSKNSLYLRSTISSIKLAFNCNEKPSKSKIRMSSKTNDIFRVTFLPICSLQFVKTHTGVGRTGPNWKCTSSMVANTQIGLIAICILNSFFYSGHTYRWLIICRSHSVTGINFTWIPKYIWLKGTHVSIVSHIGWRMMAMTCVLVVVDKPY